MSGDPGYLADPIQAPPITDEQRARARLTVADYAVAEGWNRDALVDALDMLGLS